MKDEYLCERCGHYFGEEDFDVSEDLCLKCLEEQLEDTTIADSIDTDED
jgi:formylmethanofuran dehydrogenase subunit E